MREFDKITVTATTSSLDNQKHIIENRLFILQMCKSSASCATKYSIDSDIEATLRELQDTRNQLENYRRSQLGLK